MCERNNLSYLNKEKNGEIKQILKAHNSQLHKAILLKFGMLGAEGGGCLQYKNDERGAWSYVCMKIMFYFFL